MPAAAAPARTVTGWDFSTREEAARTATFLKRFGFLPRTAGTFNYENLMVHRQEDGRIDGVVYFIPDSLYTVTAEVWLGRPQVARSIKRAFDAWCAERGHQKLFVGTVDAQAQRWVQLLEGFGARFNGLKLHLTWREH